MRFISFIGILLLFNLTVFGQKNNDLKKANQLFKEDKYALAIPYYKKALKTKKNLSVKSKLAFCYKITNQIAPAMALYEEIVNSDRPKTSSLYYYAETLMSSGRYDEAKHWYKQYAVIETDDDRVDKMIASCDFAKTVPAYFGHAMTTLFSQNSEVDDNAPVFWDNGIVFTSDRKGKLKFLDTKSGVTDRNYLRLYHSRQLSDGSFDKPKEYISKINDARKNTGMATFQADGSTMFFTRNGNVLNKQNAYSLQLFQARSEDGQNWKKAQRLSICREQSNYMHPAVSPDGKLLFFVSDKAGGLGGTDIYVSRKQKNRWSKPENLGDKVNTSGHEGFPFMHQNGKLYFCSKGHLGLGGYDIFVTQMDEKGDWISPINLGAPINSPADDISIFISENEERGLFTSSRTGGDDDIFLLSFVPQAIPVKQIITEVKEKETLEIEEIAIIEAKEPQVLIKPTEDIVQEKIPIFQEETSKPSGESVSFEEAATSQRMDFLQLVTATTIDFTKYTAFALPTVQFSADEYFITFNIAWKLDSVAQILQKHPTLTIEIASHTANLSSYKDKLDLTQKRANTIIDYLHRKGIEKNRMVAKGYGGQQPLNNCLMDIDCSIEEHSINDRIEINILSY